MCLCNVCDVPSVCVDGVRACGVVWECSECRAA